MPTTTTRPKTPAATKAASASGKAVAKKPAKTPRARMTLAEAMRALEAAGSEQTRKTYARHATGPTGPMFGVSFATLKDLAKRIGVDHELAHALWNTGNLDARNLALKVVEPERMSAADLDRWMREHVRSTRMCGGYAAMLPSEGPHGRAKAEQWLASKSDWERSCGWALFGQLSMRDETIADGHFLARLAEIEKRIHTAPNAEREAMNTAVISIGGRNAALRKAALAAAKRIGTVDVDHGDTECKTADAAAHIEKAWAYAKSKGFDSPAAQERSRDVPRRRC